MKRALSVVISLILAAVIVLPVVSSESYAAFRVRSSLPSYSSAVGKAYYYGSNNIFYQYDLGPNQKYLSSYGGYCTGNCTWYAYGRASEILGKPLNSNFRWSASRWWGTNKAGNYYPYGSTPKAGAIACYDNHVAIVEKVVNGKVYVSESGWEISKSKPTTTAKIKFHYGTPWVSKPKGYIYILDANKTVSVNYNIKITEKNLNMRTGPGTGYDRIGYVKAGTYQVNQQCGNWARLASNGYWVCLDYVTKVAAGTSAVVNTGTTANYKVKITVTNLNMRTGPGTSYKSCGYIKPGTYTVTKTNKGWGKLKETGYWVSLNYTSRVSAATSTTATSTTASSGLYTVKINTAALYMRTGPGTSYSAKGLVLYGAKYQIADTKNGWGKLSKNGYWIKLSYTIPVNGEYNVKVTVKDLNMRTGPGILYSRKGYLRTGTHTIVQTKNGWGKVKSNGYWIKLSYTKKI